MSISLSVKPGKLSLFGSGPERIDFQPRNQMWGRGSTLIPLSRGKHSRCPTNFSKAHVNRRSASFGSGILECPNEPPHGAGKCEEPRRYAPRKVDGGRYGDVDDGHRQRRIILATMHCAYLQNLLTSILTAQSNRCLDIVHTPPRSPL
jgi:hypothetical protein